MAGQSSNLHVGVRHSDGDVAIVDQNGQVMTRVGNPYQQGSYDTGLNNRQSYPGQFPQGAGQFDGNPQGQMRYPGQFPQDGSFQGYPGQVSQDGGYIPGQNSWGNPGFPGNNGQYGQERMEVQRLAQDLAFGNTREAAYLTQNLLHSPDGQRAIQQADQLADMEARQYGRYRAAEHAVTMGNGQEVLISDRGQMLAGCGNAYESQNMYGPGANVSNWNNNGWNNQDQTNGAYFNGGYPPQTYYPSQNYGQNYGNNLGSFALGTGVGVALSAIFGGGRGGYHGGFGRRR
jgi:hypothetical protein